MTPKKSQYQEVYDSVADGRWHTVARIADALGLPDKAVRDCLHEMQRVGHTVVRRSRRTRRGSACYFRFVKENSAVSTEPKPDRAKKTKSLTNQQFFQLCEYMRNNYETLAALPGRVEASAAMTQALGFRASVKNFIKAAGLLGLQFPFKPPKSQKDKPIVWSYVRSMNNALIALMEKLGEPVPQVLYAIRERMKGVPEASQEVTVGGPPADEVQRAVVENARAVLSVPVKEVPRPSTIPIANKVK